MWYGTQRPPVEGVLMHDPIEELVDQLLESPAETERPFPWRHAARFGWPLPPMAGADDDDDSPEDSEEDDDNEDEEDDDSDTEDKITVPRREHEAIRRELAEMRRKERKAEKDRKKQEARTKAEQGRYKELMEEAQQERDQAVADKEKAERDLAEHQSGRLIERVAKRLSFEDADDAEVYFARYVREGEERTNENDVEQVLKRILKDKPKLKAASKPTGGPTGGGGGGGNGGLKFTFDQVKAMSTEEINENWEDVQKTLAAQK